MNSSVTDNVAQSRFELVEEGQTAFADYRREAGRLAVLHVETPPALRGRGTAARLMQGVADQAAAAGEILVPICSYAVAWMKRQGRS